ncbi:MAG: Ig-like domain-containing protein [Bacteroidales bacterium]|nr:Ig-like domain-containing protein [Bacteroidales bacterium]
MNQKIKIMVAALMIALCTLLMGCGGGGSSEKPGPIQPPENIAVSSVVLSSTTANITVGGSLQLSATINPSNATNTTVFWTSSNSAVATVTNSGMVNGVAVGTAVVTATCGGKSATCTFTVSSPYVEFDDAAFEAFCVKNYDLNSDKKISLSEAISVRIMSANSQKIKSMKGIEHFTSLTELSCQNNELTSLDLSGCSSLTNLDCSINKLSKLDLSKCTALVILKCNENNITSLDLTKCPKVTTVKCNFNSLIEIKLDGCNTIMHFDASDNKLTKLVIPKNPALQDVDCHNNSIEALNLSDNVYLQKITASNNKLKTVDIRNCPYLSQVDVSNNLLSTMSFEGCSFLSTLYCYNNTITELDLSPTVIHNLMAWPMPSLKTIKKKSGTYVVYYEYIEGSFGTVDPASLGITIVEV